MSYLAEVNPVIFNFLFNLNNFRLEWKNRLLQLECPTLWMERKSRQAEKLQKPAEVALKNEMWYGNDPPEVYHWKSCPPWIRSLPSESPRDQPMSWPIRPKLCEQENSNRQVSERVKFQLSLHQVKLSVPLKKPAEPLQHFIKNWQLAWPSASANAQKLETIWKKFPSR